MWAITLYGLAWIMMIISELQLKVDTELYTKV